MTLLSSLDMRSHVPLLDHAGLPVRMDTVESEQDDLRQHSRPCISEENLALFAHLEIGGSGLHDRAGSKHSNPCEFSYGEKVTNSSAR